MEENGNQSLKGSVLIIGSLLWDKFHIREDWRNNYLDINEKKLVPAPIRYGRKSNERGIYTMVLSSNCSTKSRKGKAVLVPLRLDKFTLEEHCKEIINAEKKQESGYRKRFNYKFFAVGLLPNPNSKNKKLPNIVQNWHLNFGNGFDVSHYTVGTETPIITSQGFLNMDWIDEFEDIDFLVCTVIKTESNRYPYPKKIADLMNYKKDYEYFTNNQKSGITTFQDEQIKKYLQK